jgi:hypothetical protein
VSRLLVRILVTVGIVLAAVFVSVQWVAPIALSFYAAKKAPPVARVVPIDLKDKSVSKTPGEKLSYFGYDFELPWSDLDETQTKLYPKDNPKKSRVDLRFHSGLRLLVTAVLAREWINGLAEEMKVSPQRIDFRIVRLLSRQGNLRIHPGQDEPLEPISAGPCAGGILPDHQIHSAAEISEYGNFQHTERRLQGVSAR